MLAAPEVSYALLLATGTVDADRIPPPAEIQISIPISVQLMQSGAIFSDPEIADAPRIEAEQVIDSVDQTGDASNDAAAQAGPEAEAGAEAGPDTASETGPNSEFDVPPENIIVVTGSSGVPGDPLETVNIEAFKVAQEVDGVIVEPMVEAYNSVVPKPIRDGLNNFTNNLNEPVNFVNFLLQFKIGKAAETLGRFVINTTLGVGGIFDVAKTETFNLPYRNNGFANTLGYYGVKPGAYLFLPIIGSTTVRDTIGDGLDALFLPNLIGKPFNRPELTLPVTVVRAINRRNEFEERNADVVPDDPDAYAANRDRYLEQREREIDILRGRIPDPLSGESIECEVADGTTGTVTSSVSGTENDLLQTEDRVINSADSAACPA